MKITKETKKTGEHNKNENETEMSEGDSKTRDIAVKVIWACSLKEKVGLKKLPTWDHELRIHFTSCNSNSIPTPQINWEQIPPRVHDVKNFNVPEGTNCLGYCAAFASRP
jgi:hypothetical protein